MGSLLICEHVCLPVNHTLCGRGEVVQVDNRCMDEVLRVAVGRSVASAQCWLLPW